MPRQIEVQRKVEVEGGGLNQQNPSPRSKTRPKRAKFGVVIFFNLHLDKLLHGLDGAKDQYYALYALSQCLSSAAMWAEPYLCDSLLVKYAGHVVFDYSIPLGFIVYLAAASRLEPRKAKAA